MAYFAIMGLDVQYYFAYLWFAWTGGGEKPTFMNWFACAFAMVTFGIWLIVRRHKQGTKRDR